MLRLGLGREAEGGLVLAGEECQGARRGWWNVVMVTPDQRLRTKRIVLK